MHINIIYAPCYKYILFRRQTSAWRVSSSVIFSNNFYRVGNNFYDDGARDHAYSPVIGSAFASHPFLIWRITKRARVTGASEQVANASSFIARAKRAARRERARRARRLDVALDALRLLGPP